MTSDEINYCDSIAWTVCRRRGALNHLEDAKQEAALAFLCARAKFDPARGRDMGYANKRVAGAVADYLRRNHHDERSPHMPRPDAFVSINTQDKIHSNADVGHILPPIEPHGTERIEADQRLASLPKDRWRDIIHRRYWEQKSQSEVAADLGLSNGRVAPIERLALSRMRQCA
jgi:RNA polymerase sigma factor (sigma-70 family)